MALLTINDREYIVEAGTLLSDAIGLHHTLELPCGGKGRCGKCRVTASGNLSPVSETERGHLSRRELEAGIRLACCTAVEGDCRVFFRRGSEKCDMRRRRNARFHTQAPVSYLWSGGGHWHHDSGRAAVWT